MSNRTDIVVETDNAEGQVLLSASRVYDLTEDKTQDTINSEVRNTLTQLGNSQNAAEDAIAYVQSGDTASRTYTAGQFVYLKNHATLAEGLYTVNSGGIPSGTTVTGHLTADASGGLNAINDSVVSLGNSKLNGTNGLYNSGIEIRNVNETAVLIFNSMYKTTNSPSIWMEISTTNNTLTFYKDVGGGWVSMGNVVIA